MGVLVGKLSAPQLLLRWIENRSLRTPQDSPPVIGLIQLLTSREDLLLSARSYQPAELQLGKPDDRSPKQASGLTSRWKIAFGGQKEDSCGRNFSANRSCLPSERDLDGHKIEASNHKFIVEISNRVHSPAPGAGGAYHNETSIMSSLVSWPVVLEQLDQLDNDSEEKSNAN